MIFIAGCYFIFSLDLGWPSRHIACLLEDAPEESLQGQRFDWASPLLTPLACLIEDAPASSLRGQSCELTCSTGLSLATRLVLFLSTTTGETSSKLLALGKFTFLRY